jgi:hypothetical protein
VDQLASLVEWKQLRGKWRPRNLTLARSNSEVDVRTCTRNALEAIEAYAECVLGHASSSPASCSADSPPSADRALRTALRHVTVLRGVGPATASAVLSALYPDAVAYMGDEALQVVVGSPLRYNEAEFLRYSAALHARCALLNAHLPADARRFGAADLERALFAERHLPGELLLAPSPLLKSKRKRRGALHDVHLDVDVGVDVDAADTQVAHSRSGQRKRGRRPGTP